MDPRLQTQSLPDLTLIPCTCSRNFPICEAVGHLALLQSQESLHRLVQAALRPQQLYLPDEGTGRSLSTILSALHLSASRFHFVQDTGEAVSCFD